MKSTGAPTIVIGDPKRKKFNKMKRVISIEGMVGGSPCIEGTRLTCANVAQSLRYDSLETYLSDRPNLDSSDIRNSLEYCSRKQCIDDQVINYCEHCTLDTKRWEPGDSQEEIWLLAITLLKSFKSKSRPRD